MDKLNFQWRENKGQYQTGETLYLGKIRVASYGWNGSRSRGDTDDNTRYYGRITLPSLRDTGVYGSSPEDIKPKIEKVVTSWFREALGNKIIKHKEEAK